MNSYLAYLNEEDEKKCNKLFVSILFPYLLCLLITHEQKKRKISDITVIKTETLDADTNIIATQV